MAQQFDVFLSYNSHDQAAVERVAERLKRARLEPWLDKWSLTPGGEWQRELGAGLDASVACAVFVGPHDLGAWELQEVAVAVDRAATQQGFRVFPVLLPGVDDEFEPNRLPHFLRSRTWVDFRRGLNDGRAFQNLVNAIKGVPFGPDVPVVPTDDVSPYRGLRVFGEEDAQFFFGRDREIQRLIEKLKRSTFLSVLGPSGSGKSSLVQAGLVPELRAGAVREVEDWHVCVLRPGAAPLTALAAQVVKLKADAAMQATLDELSRDTRSLYLAVELALTDRSPRHRVLVVVDQLEEIFTLCPNEAERRQMFSVLLYAASAPGARTVVIVTMRADFYARCAAYPELAQLIAGEQMLVGPMDVDALRQVIEEPARRVGVEFEEGLAETILADVAEEPGALPLLEHALLELWERRRGRMLTLEGYRDAGGVHGALAQRADEIFNQLAPDQQHIARRALLRLTQPGEGTEDTRRRALRSELAPARSRQAFDEVLERMVDARMLTTGRDETGLEVVDVSHEALIRGWPRLRGWVEADRQGLVVHRRLTDAAREWKTLGREPGALYRGARLAAAREWAAEHADDLSELEREFLKASEMAERNELADAKRRTRRLRVLAAGLGALTLIAAGLTVWALNSRDAAARQRDRALSQQLGLAARDEVATDPEVALLVALEASKLARTPQAEDALRAALASPLEAVLRGHRTESLVAFSADGRLAATVGDQADARVWDLEQERQLSAFPTRIGLVGGVALSGDGNSLVVAGHRGIGLWAAKSGARRGALPADGFHADRCAFTPSQRRVTCVGGAEARIWSIPSGRMVASREFSKARGTTSRSTSDAAGSALSADGSRFALASRRGVVRVYGADDGQLVRSLPGRGVALASLQLDATGSWVLAVAANGVLLLRHADTGRESLRRRIPVIRARTSRRPRTRVAEAVLHPSGRSLVFFPPGVQPFDEPRPQVWNLDTGTRTTLATDQYGTSDLSFADDGRSVVGSVAGGATVFDLLTGKRLAILPSVGTGEILTQAFAPGGGRIVTSDANGEVRIWDPGIRLLADAPTTFTGAAFSPDGSIAAAADGATLRLWDTRTGRPVGPRGPRVPTEGQDGVVAASLRLAFSGDGSRLRAWMADDAIHDIDPVTGADRVRHIEGFPTEITPKARSSSVARREASRSATCGPPTRSCACAAARTTAASNPA